MKRIIALLLAVSMLGIVPCYATDYFMDADGNQVPAQYMERVIFQCGEGAYVDDAGICYNAEGQPMYWLHYHEPDICAFDPYTQNTEMPAASINIPPMQQDGSYNCWATCCAMIVNFRLGLNLTTTDVVYLVFPKGPGDQSGGYNECKTVMNYYGLAMGEMGPMTYAQCDKQLQYGNPIMFVGKNDRGGYHDVVIVKTMSINGIYWIYYNDPWTGTMKSQSSTNPEMQAYYMSGEWVIWEKTRWGFLDMYNRGD